MGSWGVETFANDGARAYLTVLASKLMATVNEIYADPERLALDEDGESMFMPSIELLALVCERYAVRPPKPDTVRKWHRGYLAVYDDSIDALDRPDEFKSERRHVIENTFRWLEGVSQSYWD